MDYKEVLNRYTYAGDKEIIERIKNSSAENERENSDIINSIVLWKINRQVNVDTELFLSIKKLNISHDLFKAKEKEVESVVMGLLKTTGIKIAMASTILKMFYPETFPIIDQRAYRELYNKELPAFYGKKANKKYVELYFKYIKDCCSYNEKVCPNIKFEDVDKVLYQLDLEKGNKVKY